jgi:hypothetical protein
MTPNLRNPISAMFKKLDNPDYEVRKAELPTLNDGGDRIITDSPFNYDCRSRANGSNQRRQVTLASQPVALSRPLHLDC